MRRGYRRISSSGCGLIKHLARGNTSTVWRRFTTPGAFCVLQTPNRKPSPEVHHVGYREPFPSRSLRRMRPVAPAYFQAPPFRRTPRCLRPAIPPRMPRPLDALRHLPDRGGGVMSNRPTPVTLSSERLQVLHVQLERIISRVILSGEHLRLLDDTAHDLNDIIRELFPDREDA